MVLTSLDSNKKFQIVECYYGFYGGTSKGARQAILLERYKFDCHCEACTLNWPTLQNMASRADSMKKAAQILTTVDILKSSIANKHVWLAFYKRCRRQVGLSGCRTCLPPHLLPLELFTTKFPIPHSILSKHFLFETQVFQMFQLKLRQFLPHNFFTRV